MERFPFYTECYVVIGYEIFKYAIDKNNDGIYIKLTNQVPTFKFKTKQNTNFFF